jgi:hypothetical protein
MNETLMDTYNKMYGRTGLGTCPKPETSTARTAYVVRRDEPRSADGFDYIRLVGKGFNYTKETENAELFGTADYAALAIANRNKAYPWKPTRFSIVPVTVVTTPAKYEVQRVEVSPEKSTVTLA